MVHEFSRATPATPPACGHCETGMRWYRAVLRSSAPKAITHFYACPRCDEIATIESIEGQPQPAQTCRSIRDADSGVWLAPKRNAAE